jgi:hypothetical protein
MEEKNNISITNNLVYIIKKSIYINGRTEFYSFSEIDQDVWISGENKTRPSTIV